MSTYERLECFRVSDFYPPNEWARAKIYRVYTQCHKHQHFVLSTILSFVCFEPTELNKKKKKIWKTLKLSSARQRVSHNSINIQCFDEMRRFLFSHLPKKKIQTEKLFHILWVCVFISLVYRQRRLRARIIIIVLDSCFISISKCVLWHHTKRLWWVFLCSFLCTLSSSFPMHSVSLIVHLALVFSTKVSGKQWIEWNVKRMAELFDGI